ncbi:PREDICTED: uncharacterized protein LOC105143461 [Acromyrmex echinatior]|uniref:uncharacterized protein LOC105143461 n=1 Tax=Acromyrmex echinatior TaxID=103372 RepID=UPI000580C84F|nr:PREDICTED: uncharacterized protein LOC105143461 [Acromyrmex echinatior]XP_011050118.1 PREDICTED: uncharacterized protein LOC105143461 [Acromyrmex echinatior]
MKFSCVMFICSLVIKSGMTMIQFTQGTFNSCDPGQWIMTNTKFEWENNTKIISCNVTYKESNNSIIYRIHIIMGCEDINFNCTKEPIVWIDNIDCNSQNLSSPDMKICEIGDELVKWETEKELLEYRYGKFIGDLLSQMCCISLINVDGTVYF